MMITGQKIAPVWRDGRGDNLRVFANLDSTPERAWWQRPDLIGSERCAAERKAVRLAGIRARAAWIVALVDEILAGGNDADRAERKLNALLRRGIK